MRQDSTKPERARVPQASSNDYTREMAERRREFVRSQTGADLTHTAQHSFEPSLLAGNVENFVGVAQVPIGVAGPLRIDGEHAQGDFFVPLATTEAGLIAHHGRGMRLLDECGGVKTTLTESALSRTPAFLFEDARAARDFAHWIERHLTSIREAAERSTSIGKLQDVQSFVAGPHAYLRFRYATGDVAGHNVTLKATLAACQFIREAHPDKPDFHLSGGLEGERRHASIHNLLGRGRRVVAEARLTPEPTQRILGVSLDQLAHARDVTQLGQALSGSVQASGSVASTLSALFIATGQDAASVAEAHSALVHTRRLACGDLYWSLTLPALVIGTYGGGTSLPTQREALAMLDCYGKDKANKFAEICAGAALAGELAQTAWLVHGDAPRGDKYARNRP
jgi:hydroxymethylglutaryl-CoA reductase (NADPH)